VQATNIGSYFQLVSTSEPPQKYTNMKENISGRVDTNPNVFSLYFTIEKHLKRYFTY
jgi:hypothetical protein